MKIVRNGQKVWPYCESCGCRLDIFYTGEKVSLVAHYLPEDTEEIDTDASGCRCPDIERIWNVLPAQLIGV